jgi:hypothetical protein
MQEYRERRRAQTRAQTSEVDPRDIITIDDDDLVNAGRRSRLKTNDARPNLFSLGADEPTPSGTEQDGSRLQRRGVAEGGQTLDIQDSVEDLFTAEELEDSRVAERSLAEERKKKEDAERKRKAFE